MTPQPASFAAFRHTTFRALWLSSVVSNTGGMIQIVGASWLMTMLTSSQSMVALVQSSITLPLMLVSVGAGVLADNSDRRLVMLVSQIFMLVVSVILAGLAYANLLTPWLVLSFTFLIGCGMALNNPSWQSSFSDFVPRQDLPSAVSMNAMGMNITRSVGPALGGAIVSAFGVAAAFVINALTYVTIIAALLSWRPEPNHQRLPRERFHSALVAGLRYLMLSPDLLSVNFRGFLYGFAAIAIQALLPLIARDRLDGGPLVFGILLGAFGAGAVIGALNAARLRTHLSNEILVRICFLLFAAASVVIAFSASIVLTVVTLCIAGACWLNVMSLLNVTVQMSVPRWVLGRMISLFMTWIFGGMALGGWVWGGIAENFGLTTSLLLAAVVLVLGGLWGLRFPLLEYGATNLDPTNRFNEPLLRLDLTRRSGPIKIMVDYEIAQDDVQEFLMVMAERRRTRIRDGARRWTLLRDLEDPDIWTESYQFPTWTEYVRHHERRTVADFEIAKRLTALHRGPMPLRVHRMIERQTVEPEDDMPRTVIRPEDVH